MTNEDTDWIPAPEPTRPAFVGGGAPRTWDEEKLRDIIGGIRRGEYDDARLYLFIDEVAAEEYWRGREHEQRFQTDIQAEERTALIEKIEGRIAELKRELQRQCDDEGLPDPHTETRLYEASRLRDDLLTHLRGEEGLTVNSENIERIARDAQKKLDERHPTPAEEAQLLRQSPTQEETEYNGERIVFLKETDEKVHVCRAGKTYTFTLPQEETECCGGRHRFEVDLVGTRVGVKHPALVCDCPCHKPRTEECA